MSIPADSGDSWKERALSAEDRAAELMKANDALRNGVDEVMQTFDLDTLIDGFLAEAVGVIGAKGGGVALLRQGTACTFDMIAAFDGRPLSRDEINRHPIMGTFAEKSSRDANGVFGALMRGESPVINVSSLRGNYSDGYDYHHGRGEKIMWHTPLRLRGKVWGFLAFALGYEEHPDLARREVLKVLAQQLVMVLELSRMAKETRETAVVLEREKAKARQAETDSRQEAAVLSERARLAGQIHDTLAQGFTGTLLHLEALMARQRRGEIITAEQLKLVRKVTAFGLAETRRTAVVMRPLQFDQSSFVERLSQLAERSNVPGHLQCRLTVVGMPVDFAPATDEALLNIAHEAVNNAMRHADAKQININVTFEEGWLLMEVADDGRGFDTDEAVQNAAAYGLHSMRIRADSIGAWLDVGSQNGAGSRIQVRFPSLQ